jgi:hypothetical protein
VDEAKEHRGEFTFGREIDIDADGSKARILSLKSNNDDETHSQRDPGVLLFSRRKSSRTNLLVLFVVGETPGGIKSKVFLDALDEIAWLSGWENDKSPADYQSLFTILYPHEVRIIGPAFSGSAASMRRTIDGWCDSLPPNKCPHLLIISGTATAVDDEFDHDKLITFQTAQIPDNRILERVVRNLNHGGYNSIALLGDSTAYGSGVIHSEQPDTTHDNTRWPKLLVMSFPLHISDLRTVYNEARQQPSAIAVESYRRNLPLLRDNDQQRQDILPSFQSGRQHTMN